MTDFWVFGYGSLMWRPGFSHVERVPARLIGLHRALCVYSHVHRGTPERPGLVLGLDRGGACRGVAFRVEPDLRDEVVAYLRAREQVTMVYLEATRQIEILDGTRRTAPALCYVVDREHPQYAGKLSFEDQIRYVRQGQGQSGANAEYVLATLDHMDEIGVVDKRLSVVGRALRTPEGLPAS
ncbi:gamma-glutamylcyclotransferase [Microbaculum marinum]|uniref:glutathione-specific gamma-glutamylcyclotransferase n=1 Tax=Microbaculum marinum TaxID=1764581 RepID=A0AAW9RCD9_9HYPH